MPAVRGGDPRDEVEQREPGGAARGEAVTGEEFAFKRGEEALGRRMIEAIATTAHGTDESGSRSRRPKAKLVSWLPWSA